MTALIAATLLLFVSHFVPSAPGRRERLIAVLGRGGFYAAYSAFSLLALGLMIWAYRAAGPTAWLYGPFPWARPVAVIGMFVPFFLLVGRLTQRPDPDQPRGIYGLTVVPGSLAVLLWTLLHLLNVGEARTVVIFAAMAIIALVSLVKHATRASPAQRGAGIVPFAGILRGRQRPSWHEIGGWRLALAAAVYAAVLTLHPLVIGVDPLAGW